MTFDWLGWAERFIATPSVSDAGNATISEIACELLASAGLSPRVELAEIAGTTHYAVLAELGPSQCDDGLLLVTHLDTVPAGDPADWTATDGDPWKPTFDGDRLYGLGSADAKVDMVAKVAALASLPRKKLQRRIRIAGTFGEEIGLLGARWLVERGLTAGFRYALVGEPSELVAIRAHKGYAVFEARIPAERLDATPDSVCATLDATGTSCHSSTPQLGENAIERALDQLRGEDVVGLIELEGGGAVNKVPDRCHLLAARRSVAGSGPPVSGSVLSAKPLLAFLDAWREQLGAWRETTDDDFDPAFTVGNLGRIAAREGELRVRFDVRPVPGLDLEAAIAPLREYAEIECVRSNPALSTPADSDLIAALAAGQREAGYEPRVGTKATCTEAGLLATGGLDAVVFGAGISVGNVHRPNEYTLLSQIDAARRIYAHAIAQLCLV